MGFKCILVAMAILNTVGALPCIAHVNNIGHYQPLNKAERIEKIEDFLNSIRTFKATFQQSDQDNNTRKGEFYLARPNKMRFDYSDPQKESIILNEDFLIYFNEELDEINYVSADSFPVGFLSKDRIDLKSDTKILNVADLDYSMSIELLVASEGKALPKKIILEFNKNPMNLVGFYLQEDSGQTIRITLTNITLNQPIDDSKFEVK